MVNYPLALSATLVSGVHIVAFYLFNPPLAYTLFLSGALGTSIWNHLVTSELAKWLDRAAMAAGTVITFTIAPTVIVSFLMCLTLCAYFAGKFYKSTPLHAASHWLITTANVIILASIV